MLLLTGKTYCACRALDSYLFVSSDSCQFHGNLPLVTSDVLTTGNPRGRASRPAPPRRSSPCSLSREASESVKSLETYAPFIRFPFHLSDPRFSLEADLNRRVHMLSVIM